MIAPDRPAGEDFFKVFEEEINKSGLPIGLEIVYPYIPPRVMTDGSMNPSPEVAQGLAAAIRDGYVEGFREMVIACNTLQLWVPEAVGLLPEEMADVQIYTSIEAVRGEYIDPQVRPLWLGTTPIVRAVSYDFPTLLTLERQDLQDLSQEIIWRVKAVTGADFANAQEEVQINAKDENVLREEVGTLIGQLGSLPVKQFIMGCTELSLALVRYLDEEGRPDLEKIELIDPTVILARNVV